MQKIEPPSLKEQGYIPKRYVIAILMFLGHGVNYMLRVNINFAIIAMVNSTESEVENGTITCPDFEDDSSGSDAYEGPFEWDTITQGLITGSFYWGYLWTQVPGGRLAEVAGARKVFGGGLAGIAFLTLLVPVAANLHYSALIVVRVLMGLLAGPTFPCSHAVVAVWGPPTERTLLATIILAGSQFGTIITFPMSAAIIDSLGWEAVFYIQAVIAFVWVIFWFLFTADTPTSAKRITHLERTYIMNSIGDEKSEKPPPIPWKDLMTSLPFLAILVASVGNDWGFYTLITDLPLYMKNVLRLDINSNALLSALPYLGMWIFSLVMSSVGDWLRFRETINTVQLRKGATFVAHIFPAICLISMSFVECNREASIGLLFLAITFQGAMYTGFMVNHIDIAPNFAATLYGITNAAGTITGWLAPLTVGALTNDDPNSMDSWKIVFDIAATLFILDFIFYVIFGSGVEQRWNKTKVSNSDDEKGVSKKMEAMEKKTVDNAAFEVDAQDDEIINKN